jgi:hypothetical protein
MNRLSRAAGVRKPVDLLWRAVDNECDVRYSN